MSSLANRLPVLRAQIQTLLLITLGAILASNDHYHQLLGNTVKQVGGGLIFTGLLYLLSAVLGYFSARTQNKFLLLVVRLWRSISALISPALHR